jgi:hypothetical protein
MDQLTSMYFTLPFDIELRHDRKETKQLTRVYSIDVD